MKKYGLLVIFVCVFVLFVCSENSNVDVVKIDKD